MTHSTTKRHRGLGSHRLPIVIQILCTILSVPFKDHMYGLYHFPIFSAKQTTNRGKFAPNAHGVYRIEILSLVFLELGEKYFSQHASFTSSLWIPAT
ncbi:hypothetical protein TNIN_21511 [Trichonephila inaurata madagascariensis]|uniref:Uncharacterized protein n=1 Tax=Trichonephila inaurata madagascariensis TaxID=2747483 RepID=A0A8X6X845_9ARAC|nr:hypothetical protein TNIN_21511 [Trichonephila inaurata madagascariensis]